MAGKEEEARVGMTWGLILAQEIPCQLTSVKKMCCLGNDLLLLEFSEDAKKILERILTSKMYRHRVILMPCKVTCIFRQTNREIEIYMKHRYTIPTVISFKQMIPIIVLWHGSNGSHSDPQSGFLWREEVGLYKLWTDFHCVRTPQCILSEAIHMALWLKIYMPPHFLIH